MSAAKQKHVRIVCQHCGKNVSLSPPRTPLGFVKPIPCPNCHIPITPEHVRAQTEPPAEPAELDEEPEGEGESAADGEPAAEGESID
ncbi:MAG: hypothetical protein MAG451_01523 [Anaerolineales bacterium]|nr:hypothetical protein [Anaerolineales bacterium]